MKRLGDDYDHLTAILQALLAKGDVEPGLQLTILFQELWFEPQYTADGLNWLKTYLSLPAGQARPAQRASALDLAGAYALNLGNYDEAPAFRRTGIEDSQKQDQADGATLSLEESVELASRILSYP